MDPFTICYNDDEISEIIFSNQRTVQMQVSMNNMVPLEENIQKVLLAFSSEENMSFDLVAVLDVSSSMEGEKLENMKIAMLSVMKKLSLTDRLSIVEYSCKAKRLCPLRQMTVSSQTELENLIKDMKVQPGTNITDGLETALNVLKDRSYSKGRSGIIMLMSDGEQNTGGDATGVEVGNVLMYTFGFGEDHNQEVLMAIADNSELEGTYTDVSMDNLNIGFSNWLGQLHSVAAWDLKVTVTQFQDQSTLKPVSIGRSYPQFMDNNAGSLTIVLGIIPIQVVHKVLIELLLPVTKERQYTDILQISYTYSFEGNEFEQAPCVLHVLRKSELTEEEQQVSSEITAEEVRMLIVELIKKSTGVAHKDDLKSTRDKLVHGLKTLRDDDMLLLKAELRAELELVRAELEEQSELMQSQAINEKLGGRFAYSLLISTHRGSASGNSIRQFQILSTPAMREFLENANMYDKIDDLHVYTDRFLCAIESIQMIIDKV